MWSLSQSRAELGSARAPARPPPPNGAAISPSEPESPSVWDCPSPLIRSPLEPSLTPPDGAAPSGVATSWPLKALEMSRRASAFFHKLFCRLRRSGLPWAPWETWMSSTLQIGEKRCGTIRGLCLERSKFCPPLRRCF